MQQRPSSQRSENPQDIHPGHREASRHALPTTRCRCDEPRYDMDDRYMERTLGDHERMTTRERANIQEGEAYAGRKRPSAPQGATYALTISRSRRA